MSMPTLEARGRGALASVAARTGFALLAFGALSADAEPAAVEQAAIDRAHRELLGQDEFPPASACRNCHPNHYDEWSISQHAGAQLSPVFNAMHGTILERTNGTLGDFCIRCHSPIGMHREEPLFISNLERSREAIEGVSCAVCHRIAKPYGKVSGRLGLREGGIEVPVNGPTGPTELLRVLAAPDIYPRPADLETGEPLGIHEGVVEFSSISSSDFCASCHDVTSVGGLRLEEAFSEHRNTPAAKDGTTCQDCHMGQVPGRVSGYRWEPAAHVAGRPTAPRKRTDHRFVGPDHSIVHPGIFPHDVRAQELASMAEWLQFDWEAGWGSDDFEDLVDLEQPFPERWADSALRQDAREIIEDNLARLDDMAEERRELLKRGYVLGEVELRERQGGLRIAVEVRNGTDGHVVPTGFTGERLVWLHAMVSDADGNVRFESGDLDPNGDLRDEHSSFVRDGRLPRDEQLFNLQSKFVLANHSAGEREEILAVNDAPDPLPFVRPDPRPNVLDAGPAAVRLHKKGIPAGGKRRHVFRVPRQALRGPGPHRVVVELKAAMVPVNLVTEIQHVGFDYGLSPAEVARRVVAGHQVLWTRELTHHAPEPS